jgi:hypothetical protein
VLADISLYTISLWLHITAAVVGLGATFALAVAFRSRCRWTSATCRTRTA